MAKRRQQRGRPIDGILVLDKPKDITSNAALQRIKHMFGAQKAGHTGSLDPLASGMLPICFGKATKLCQFLLASDKSYQVTAKLGVRTTTGDTEGETVSERPVPNLTNPKLETLLDNFRGTISQVPSMYSAIKHQGQPLYKLARQGIEVEREAREVTISRLEVITHQNDVLSLEVDCSKGTYIRTLVEDIGEAMGCGAHVTELRRVKAGPYQAEQMVTFAELDALLEQGGPTALDVKLLPMMTAVSDWPEVVLSSDMAFYVRQGEAVMIPKSPTDGWVKMVHESGDFIGLGEIQDDGRICPRRLL